MAYTTINKSSLNMNTKLYTGTGSSNSVTGVGFQPDMTWFKHRNGTSEHNIYDAVRGATKRIIPNDATAEGTQSNGLSAFGSDGFTVVDSNATNLNNGTYASWNWKAGTSFSNSAGANGASIASTGSINTTSGFSIISFTGTQTAGTIAHGLGAVPKMIIVKSRTQADGWYVYHVYNTATKYMRMETTGTLGSGAAFWNNTAPTSTVFSVGNGTGTNYNGAMIAYCFADKQGYSKFGSYIGNGNADGTFIYTGFKPAFLITKKTSGSSGWQIRDNKRTPAGNLTNNLLNANATSAEQTTDGIDILSNGFKFRNTAGESNASGGTYIYMAFGQSIVGTNNIPATAF